MAEPGKYHSLCEEVRDKTGADGAVVMIYSGELGNGFSMVGSPEFCCAMPAVLRSMADQLEAEDRSMRLLLS